MTTIKPSVNFDAIAQRETARTKLEQSAQTVARAEHVANAHAADVTKKEAALTAAQTQTAKVFADLVAADDPSVTRGVWISPALIETTALEDARLRATVSTTVLSTLRKAHAEAQAELQAAELAVEDAAIAIYVREVEADAREATEYRAKSEAALERVRYAQAITNQFDREVGARLYSALDTHAILNAGKPAAPPERLPSDWGKPPHETSAARRAADGIRPWRERFAALLRGDTTKADSSKAA